MSSYQIMLLRDLSVFFANPFSFLGAQLLNIGVG